MTWLSLDSAAQEVLCRFPAALAPGTLVGLGNHGGFSGARLWRLEAGGQALCLRAWPPSKPSSQRLEMIHGCMQRACAAGLAFVPALRTAGDGATAVEHAGRLWEITSWMPGRADFHERPTVARLEAVMTALAELHAVWSNQSEIGRASCRERV